MSEPSVVKTLSAVSHLLTAKCFENPGVIKGGGAAVLTLG